MIHKHVLLEVSDHFHLAQTTEGNLLEVLDRLHLTRTTEGSLLPEVSTEGGTESGIEIEVADLHH